MEDETAENSNFRLFFTMFFFIPQHSWHNMISILLLDSSILYIAKQIDFSEKYLAYDFVTSAKIQCPTSFAHSKINLPLMKNSMCLLIIPIPFLQTTKSHISPFGCLLNILIDLMGEKHPYTHYLSKIFLGKSTPSQSSDPIKVWISSGLYKCPFLNPLFWKIDMVYFKFELHSPLNCQS